MDGAYCPLEAVQPYDDTDCQFARTLGDGNNVDVFPGNCGKHASRQSGRSAHPFAHYSQ